MSSGRIPSANWGKICGARNSSWGHQGARQIALTSVLPLWPHCKRMLCAGLCSISQGNQFTTCQFIEIQECPHIYQKHFAAGWTIMALTDPCSNTGIRWSSNDMDSNFVSLIIHRCFSINTESTVYVFSFPSNVIFLEGDAEVYYQL